jgi:hypothetical protein
MSALGQKQTYAAHNLMSALPPKADMRVAQGHVCFGPEADIALLFTPPLWPAKCGEKDGQTGVK